MGVPYDSFAGAFLSKITEYEFQDMFGVTLKETVDGYTATVSGYNVTNKHTPELFNNNGITKIVKANNRKLGLFVSKRGNELD